MYLKKLSRNGKIATITKITDNKIEVKDNKETIIAIERDKWENIKYVINKDTKNIDNNLLSNFVYPFFLHFYPMLSIFSTNFFVFIKSLPSLSNSKNTILITNPLYRNYTF